MISSIISQLSGRVKMSVSGVGWAMSAIRRFSQRSTPAKP
jgi:hypothetical protein